MGLSKTGWKTLSWLLVSGALIFIADFAVTRNWRGSVAAALAACLLKTPAYAIHEVLFENIWVRRVGES